MKKITPNFSARHTPSWPRGRPAVVTAHRVFLMTYQPCLMGFCNFTGEIEGSLPGQENALQYSVTRALRNFFIDVDAHESASEYWVV